MVLLRKRDCMNSQKLEEDVRKITENFSEKDFIFDFLLAFGFTKMSINRLREGNSNLASKANQLVIKQKLFYEYSPGDNLYSIIDDLKDDSATYTHKPRFIIVQNAKKLLAIDTKTKETLDTEINELYKHKDFFLPWTGKEKYIVKQENPADVKAAEKMAKLYDEIVKINHDLQNNHSLNVFLARLLFCFFAEDTGIFKDNLFTKTIANHTDDNGSDLKDFLAVLFESLDKKDNEKTDYPTYIQEFPYVNGKLFTQHLVIPKLNSKIRKLIIECGEQDWKEINPDIFGSMFQAVSDNRSEYQQHYTSVPNIMKVIEPLFLNNLKEEFENADTENKLKKLLNRIYNIKIFDPACGSGNFLIIAYKQLRFLEMEIIQKIQKITGQQKVMLSQIQLNQFYGIEIDDFACEIATLSLWLAEHQMNRKFKDLFGECSPALPLSKSGNIVCGNATRLNWEEVCPKGTKGITKKQTEQMKLIDLDKTKQLEIQGSESEIYILGNPPYRGTSKQSTFQKDDKDFVYKNSLIKNYKKLDYISCWFYKAAQYIDSTKINVAFVTTNSICQGEQVSILWTSLFERIKIMFAYESFLWKNNAKDNAAVAVTIVGISLSSKAGVKKIYTINQAKEVANINAYLINGNNIFVEPVLSNSISKLPSMIKGSAISDDGNLIFSPEEAKNIINRIPQIEPLLKKYISNKDFMDNTHRYILYIPDECLEYAEKIPDIKIRLDKCREFRAKSTKKATQKKALFPHHFDEMKYKPLDAIIIPQTGSARRVYTPIGFLDKNTIPSNSFRVIYNFELWLFGVLSSYMHALWIKLVSGRQKEDPQYSKILSYNTFPFPDITDKQKQTIEYHVNNVLAEREKHSDKTMAELYDPDKMPQGLREAHQSLDIAIEKCYRSSPFESDEKRLEYLFKMYEIMTNPNKQLSTEEQLSLL